LASLTTGFFFCVFAQNDNNNPPSILNYAPNFQFDSEEKYYPADPLDFYFENGEEIEGEKARKKYYNLSDEAKKDNFVVFYHIEDEGDHWVYQYWIFCVFNDNLTGPKNKHYSDWEAVFVFVDKNSKEVIRTVGTAHQRRIFDTEIKNPKTNHIWAYVANGSHAICVDEEDDGKCDFKRWKKLEKWNKNGYKAAYSSYKLKEITQEYIENFKGETSLTKSPVLGIDLSDIITFNEENENEFNPEDFEIRKGGGTPPFAWHQKEYHNPSEVRPRDTGYAAEMAGNKIKETSDKITNFFGGLTDKASNLFKKSVPFQEAGIGGVLIDNPVFEVDDDLSVIPIKKNIIPIQQQPTPC